MNSRKQFICDVCGRCFGKKHHVRRHIENLHSVRLRVKKNGIDRSRIKCFMCGFSCNTSCAYDCHLGNAHHLNIETKYLCFSSEIDFIQWKELEEIRSKSQYVKRSCSRKNANGDLVTYYFCNRRGLYRSKVSDNERRRKLRAKGTSKIGLSCSARMVTTFSSKDGKVHVMYYSTHVGHELQMCYLNLPEGQERLIAGKIKEGVTLDHILDEITGEVFSSTTTLEKKHFLNRKKLFNIMQKYNLAQSEKYHNVGEVSVDTLVERCRHFDDNPILLFKKQGAEHEILDVDEFMIIIMTKMQREVLKKFSTETICIDSTHSTNGFDFQLTTVMVLDEYGEGFPACFCVSSRVNEKTMALLFEEIKQRTGIIYISTFMSDDANCFYNAWKKVMSAVSCRLLCKWHVDRAWKKELVLIQGKQARSEVYASLRLLLEESDEKEFTVLLQNFLRLLRSKKYDEFYNYFNSNYVNRTSVWASCYRTEAFLNTNMCLEAFHRILEYVYLNSRKNNRVDVLINSLFKILRNKVFAQLIQLEEGHVNHCIQEINERHRWSMEITDVIEISENEWHVMAVCNENSFYSIIEKSKSCECKRKCLLCKVCIHMFSCTCNDYIIKHNLCKHIHAVVKFQKPVEETVPTYQEIDFLSYVEVCSSETSSTQEIAQEVRSIHQDEILEQIFDENAKQFPSKNKDGMVVQKQIFLNKLQELYRVVEEADDDVLCQFLEKDTPENMMDGWITSLFRRTKTSNKKVDEQFYFHSNKKKQFTKCVENNLKVPTTAQKNTLQVVSMDCGNIMDIHTGFDHSYCR